MALPNTHTSERTIEGGHPAVRHAVESMLLEERTRWAMQIHDSLTQSVTSAVLELQTLRHRIETEPASAIETLREVEEEIRLDLRRIREVLFELTEEEPPSAEAPLAAQIRRLAARWQLPTTLEIVGDVESLEDARIEAAHEITREALANAAKHSGAPEAHIRLVATDEALRVEIEDRGRGVVVVDDDDNPHFGVRIMRARAEALGGTLTVESTPGRGTTVVAVLPEQRAGENG